MFVCRNYEAAVENNMPNVVKKCMDLFMSEAMFLTLSSITGLSLHHLAPQSDDDTGSTDSRYMQEADWLALGYLLFVTLVLELSVIRCLLINNKNYH